MEHALELNRLLQAKVKVELQRIEEELDANQKMQLRVELLIKEAAIVRKTTRCRVATFYPSLNKSVCVSACVKANVSIVHICFVGKQRPMDNDDAIAKHTHGVTPLYAYEKCL